MTINTWPQTHKFSVKNKTAYEDQKIVKEYYQAADLQPPEETILKTLKPSLASMDMLDIGVGGGRTTVHFANQVKSYVGTDYSEGMIKACQQRFGATEKHISFAVADARAMTAFPDNIYDFILFSFNGIDYLSETERLIVFKEIKRLGKSGGYFCFSTHNLQSIHHLFDLRCQWHKNPKIVVGNLLRWSILHSLHTPSQVDHWKQAQRAIFNDGAHRFSLKTYYTRPTTQLAQLQPWFEDIQVYSWKTGQAIKSQTALAQSTDPWLYYLCKIR